jgi:hypothetical protein
MRTDVRRGKTEVAEFNGAIAEAAGKLGLRAPINAGLARLTKNVTADPGECDRFHKNPPALIDELSVGPLSRSRG